MAKRKTEFQMVWATGHHVAGVRATILKGIGGKKPRLCINPYQSSHSIFIQDKDLETFALNILKAIKSKHLKT